MGDDNIPWQDIFIPAPSFTFAIGEVYTMIKALVCFAVLAGIALAAQDNIIHEVRFADPYRHWSASEHSKSQTIYAGDAVLIRMNENPGTGFRWVIVEDFDTSVCSLQATASGSDGLFEPSTSTDGSDDKVVDGVARPYVPPGRWRLAIPLSLGRPPIRS